MQATHLWAIDWATLVDVWGEVFSWASFESLRSISVPIQVPRPTFKKLIGKPDYSIPAIIWKTTLWKLNILAARSCRPEGENQISWESLLFIFWWSANCDLRQCPQTLAVLEEQLWPEGSGDEIIHFRRSTFCQKIQIKGPLLFWHRTSLYSF